MNLLISGNSSPQIPQNKKVHRGRRLNLAALKHTSLLFSAQNCAQPESSSEQSADNNTTASEGGSEEEPEPPSPALDGLDVYEITRVFERSLETETARPKATPDSKD